MEFPMKIRASSVPRDSRCVLCFLKECSQSNSRSFLHTSAESWQASTKRWTPGRGVLSATGLYVKILGPWTPKNWWQIDVHSQNTKKKREKHIALIHPHFSELPEGHRETGTMPQPSVLIFSARFKRQGSQNSLGLEVDVRLWLQLAAYSGTNTNMYTYSQSYTVCIYTLFMYLFIYSFVRLSIYLCVYIYIYTIRIYAHNVSRLLGASPKTNECNRKMKEYSKYNLKPILHWVSQKNW